MQTNCDAVWCERSSLHAQGMHATSLRGAVCGHVCVCVSGAHEANDLFRLVARHSAHAPRWQQDVGVESAQTTRCHRLARRPRGTCLSWNLGNTHLQKQPAASSVWNNAIKLIDSRRPTSATAARIRRRCAGVVVLANNIARNWWSSRETRVTPAPPSTVAR